MNATDSENTNKYTQNFWVCASPFLTSTLFLQSVPQAEISAFASFFDPDGELFNELKVGFGENHTTGILDLEPFLSECKFESGMKYCRLQLNTSKYATALIRLQSRDWSVIAQPAQRFSATEKYLIPVEQENDKSSWIVVLNENSRELDIRVRLFMAKRSPELDLKVPAFGSRVFDIKTLFSDIFTTNMELLQAYVRVSVVGSLEGHIQSVSIPNNSKLPRVFSVLV